MGLCSIEEHGSPAEIEQLINRSDPAISYAIAKDKGTQRRETISLSLTTESSKTGFGLDIFFCQYRLM
jgi:hypothetical protein